MPDTGPAPEPSPGTKTTADAMQSTTQAAVIDSVANPTSATQTITGTLQGAAQTTPGAVATTSAVTGGSVALGNLADLQELPSAAWLTTWLYQGIKHHHLVDQDKHKVYWLVGLAAFSSFGIVYLMSHGDLWMAGAHAARCCGVAAYQSSLNYQLAKPLGIFSSAEDVVTQGG